MLNVEALSKSYGQTRALREVTFQVTSGQVFGFLGPNGAGKTTAMNIIAGLIEFDSGTVTIDGMDLRRDQSGLRGVVGYLPESPAFYGYMTAREYLLFIGDVSGLTPVANRARADELLETVGLAEAGRRRIGGYSRGMKQRLGMAAAIYNRPRLLLLDEPTSALDPQGRLDVITLVGRMRDAGMTVFLSTHILADVERVCDSVAVIKSGAIVAADSMARLRESYIQPVVDVVFDRVLESVPTEITSAPHVDRAALDGDRLSVFMRDLSLGKRELLHALAGLDAGVASYSVRQPSLEDIFVRLVNSR
ncbi:MAG: ABC transporter ATP-binding protein [Firmicutes bacterium]|nr:ABC transporter ATP-binding protein [Bacillota bacterium]